MANQVDICNGALVKLGAEQINSIDDDKKSAIKCKLRYDAVRKYVLRSHNWKCVKDRAALSPLTGVPAFEWGYAFPVPSDLLRLWLVVDSNGRPQRKFEFESRHILIDVDAINIKYIRNEEDATQFDDMLVEALSFYLAFDIGYSITQDRKLVADMASGYQTTLRLARSVDGKEDYPKSIQANKWNTERVRNSSPPTRFPFLQ